MRLLVTLLITGLVACSGADEPDAAVVAPDADAPAADAPSDEPAAARVFFVEPADGAEVTSPITIKMGVEGMAVEKAGTDKPGTGHHHIIVGGPHVAEGEVVPSNETHIHFGAGETETELELEPGEYTLRLQFADFEHRSYGEGMSEAMTITVVEADE